jgi:hypothetical protein
VVEGLLQKTHLEVLRCAEQTFGELRRSMLRLHGACRSILDRRIADHFPGLGRQRRRPAPAGGHGPEERVDAEGLSAAATSTGSPVTVAAGS